MELLLVVPEQTERVANDFENNILPPKWTAAFLVVGFAQKNFLSISETKPRRFCGIVLKKITFQSDFLREEESEINLISFLAPLIAASKPFGEQIAVLCIFSNTVKIFSKGTGKILI